MGTSSAPTVGAHEMLGRAEVRRVGRLRFPVFELVQDGAVLASMGRAGWIKVFLGRGQRIQLDDGSRWRLKSTGSAGMVCPAIVDDHGRKIALSSVVEGGYGINGKAFGVTLHVGESKRVGRSNRWILRHYEDEIATVTRHPLTVEAAVPIHLGAALMSFTLARYGVMGESRPTIKMRWG